MMNLYQRHYGENGLPIIILHGILGSGRNWHSAAKLFADDFRVIVPDLRNHGHSPHRESHNLEGLVDDLIALQETPGVSPSVVLGHSLGGLVACETAFKSASSFKALIVIDIAPRSQRSPVTDIINAMENIDLSAHNSRQSVDESLALLVPDPVVRQFILTNLKLEQPLTWRVNLPALKNYLTQIQTYQPARGSRFSGPALFIRGQRSNYIRDEDEINIKQYFPQAKIVTVPEAGHWVHYDNLPGLIFEVRTFLRELV